MEIAKLVQIFQATLDQNQHQDAQKLLTEMHRIIGFLPTVLQVASESSVELPVRHAAAIYFKNELLNYWQEKEAKKGQLIYSIHAQDKALIRSMLVDALVHSPDAIRPSLALALNCVIKNDFPECWTDVVDKIHFYLRSAEPNKWMGALTCLLQIAKSYEYKNNNDKKPMIEVLHLVGPHLHKMMVELMNDNSEQAVSLQKIILKIIFTVTQYSLPLNYFTKEVFTQWMEVLRQVLDRQVPPETEKVDIDERPQLCWYKAKKWAIHILVRIFDRYGQPKNTQTEYKEFARWYLKTFSLGIIQTILKMLDEYSRQVYLSPRILQQCINYLNHAVELMETWKLLKPHIAMLVEKVIFPLMCHSEEDAELWVTDPQEYIRQKFDFYEDYVSPVSAAQNFLSICCKKRKDMLTNTVAFSVQVLRSDTSTFNQKDGALHILGVVSELLLKKKVYLQQINEMLTNYVFPFFSYDCPFLRARAAWVLHYFENFDFENELTLTQAITCLQNCLLHDNELPVRVQACISLHFFIHSNVTVRQAIETNLSTIIIEYLKVIEQSHNDDVTNALQRIIFDFGKKVIPIASQIIEHLANTLTAIITNNDENEDRTITAMGILSAIDSVLIMIENKEVLLRVEPVALKAILLVLNNHVSDLYEETFNIVETLTDTTPISSDMWQLYECFYSILTNKESVDYFTDMMSSLHNYIVVQPEQFIAEPKRVVAFFEICKFALEAEMIEDTHANVVKMIECFVLQFREKAQDYIPSFVQIVLVRFMADIKMEELQTICLQVMITVFYFNHDLLFAILEKLQPLYPNKPLVDHIFRQWMENLEYFLGLHDRKVCLLGISKLLSLEANKRPLVVNEFAGKLIPDTLKLFEKLKEAYKAKALVDVEDEESDVDTEEDEEDEIDEEENNGTKAGNFNNVVNHLQANLPFDVKVSEMEDEYTHYSDSDSEIEDDLNELTPLENFETTIDKDDSPDDEYIFFRKAVELLKHQDPTWYGLLFTSLNESQLTTLNDIFVLAQRRQDAAESRKIEQGGGYVFANQTVPTSFNFGGVFTGQP